MNFYLRGTLMLVFLLIAFPIVLAQDNSANATDPLVRVLLTKGVLTPEEARLISIDATPAQQRDRLAMLLREKGVISAAEFEAVRTFRPGENAPLTGRTADY